MAEIHVDDEGAQHRLEQLAVFLQDLRSFWPMVVPLVTGWWRRQFDTEGAFAGERWAPLSPAYAIAKEHRYPGRGILVASGEMRLAASRPSRTQTPTSLTLTIEDDKLEYHQTGHGAFVHVASRRAGGAMPARPLVFGDPLPGLAQAEVNEAMEEYLTDLLRRL